MNGEHPEKIGQYAIDGVLGSGGMSTIYKGIQPSLNRPVAIKVLPLHLAKDDELVDRFERESSIIATLNHPNIIQIIDRGTDKGHYFIVMELIEGCSLDELIRDKRLPVYQVVSIAMQIAMGIEHAHSKGVVHRDIKPSNVLISSDSGAIKLTDFGIAKLAEEHLADRMLTRDQVAMGTADYMSPEQRRDSRHIDQRSDIFSFGVLLYEMHTGRIPVGRFREPHQLRDDTPPLLNQIILRCLHDEPEDRYQTFTEVIADLNKLTQRGLVYRKALARMSESVSHFQRKVKTTLTGKDTSPLWSRVLRLTGVILLAIALITFLSIAIIDSMKKYPQKMDLQGERMAEVSTPFDSAPVSTPEVSPQPETPPPVDFSRVETLVSEKKYDEALTLLNGIRASAGERGDVKAAAEAQWRIANIQEERGSIHDAGIAYGDFVDAYGKSDDVMESGRLAEAMFRAGMFKADDKEFESAIVYLSSLRIGHPSYPRGDEAMLKEISILNDRIQPSPADEDKHQETIVGTCLSFLERFPESLEREVVLWRLSKVYADMGGKANYLKAIDTLEEMARDYPQSVFLPLFEAAEINLDKLGDSARAGQLYEEFLQDNPGSDKAVVAQERLNTIRDRADDRE
jgi:serine/threonine protein kinase